MEITEQEFQAATLCGEEVRRRGYAVRADYDSRQNRLVVDLNTGVTIMVPVDRRAVRRRCQRSIGDRDQSGRDRATLA